MRDIAVLSIFLVLCFDSFRSPPIAIYLWTWLGYMNPHKLTWGFVYSLPLAQFSFIVLVISMIVAKRPLRFPLNALTVTWIVLLLWFGVTTITAYNPAEARDYIIVVLKIQIVAILTICLIHSYKELRILIWVIALSIGFFGIKGGVFTVLTGGAHRVWGPQGSFIADNNYLAIALLIVLPLFIFLIRTTEDKRIKIAMWFCFASISFSVLGSWSRGAFVAAAAVFGFLWLKSQRKLVGAIAITTIGIVALPFMPDGWTERMRSIETYEQDASANARLYSWGLALKIANDRIMGGGFKVWGERAEMQYTGVTHAGHVAHSIYFHMAGEHGYPGLAIYLLLLYLAWRQAKLLIKSGRKHPELEEYAHLGRALQVSLVAYCIGGAFISISYFDLLWNIIGIILIAHRQCEDFLATKGTSNSAAGSDADIPRPSSDRFNPGDVLPRRP